MHIILFGLLLFSLNVFALDFNQVCKYNQGQQDCSNEFIEALTILNESNEALIFEEDEIYRLENIDTASLDFSNIKLLGVSTNKGKKPTILTNKLYLFDINNLLINNLRIMGINNNEGETEQSNTLVLIGSKNKDYKAENLTVSNSEFVNSAEDLLVFWNSQNVTVNNNEFRRSGLAMRIAPIIGDPNDLRPRGSGLLFHNIIDASINFNEFYEMKKFAIFFDGSDLLDKNINIFNNHIDMLNFEKPTKRYGLKGGAGIYIGNSTNSHNIRIQGNRILNYTMNGMRINGSEIIVKNNFFNFRNNCNEHDESITGPLVGMAVKAHFLIDSEITGNCVRNTSAGIVLETWKNIKNINIENNTITDAKASIYITHKYSGVYSNLKINRNILLGSINNGIAMYSNGLSEGNSITGNTMVDKSKSLQGPLISLQNQTNLYFDNNWLTGQATSLKWNFLRLRNVHNSSFKRSAINSFSGNDKAYGGIYIEDPLSSGNYFKDITFKNLSPGVHDNGINNIFDNITIN